jgi:4-amino-4-deoxy-L-arabinose transferase-like glycosyltransferase
MLASLLINTYNNEHIPPGLHGDEAESGLEARNLNTGRYNTLIGIGWYDQTLPSFLVQAWGLHLFGDTTSGLRTTSAVVGALSLPFVYLLARSLFGAQIGLLTVILMACAHWFIAYTHLGVNYNQTTFLQVVAVWTFWEGWQRRRWTWFIVSGLATGAGLYLYFASRLVPILLGTFAAYLWLSTAYSQWRIAYGEQRSGALAWHIVDSLKPRFSRLTSHASHILQLASHFTLDTSRSTFHTPHSHCVTSSSGSPSRCSSSRRWAHFL